MKSEDYPAVEVNNRVPSPLIGQTLKVFGPTNYDHFDTESSCNPYNAVYDSFDTAPEATALYDDFDPVIHNHEVNKPPMIGRKSTTLLYTEESPPSSPRMFPPKIISDSVQLPPHQPTSSGTAIIDLTSKISGLDEYGSLDPDSIEFGRKSTIESMMASKLRLPSHVYDKYDEVSCPSSAEDLTSSEDELIYESPKRKLGLLNNSTPIRPVIQSIPFPVESSIRPCPLSPDALTSFSNHDPHAYQRNQEVIRATDRLVHEVIPAVAHELSLMTPQQISVLNFSIYLHAHGVNIRHMGLVRSLVPISHATNPIRTALLLQIVCRTLKNITRDYQRRWMKSEQSTSEQGMYILLIQLLNLIIGSHINSEQFWTERVIVGIIQRYGGCAIDSNIDELQRIRKLPQFLKVL